MAAEDPFVREFVVPGGYHESNGRAPELSPEPIDKRPIIYGIIAAVIIIVIFAVLGYFLFRYPETTAVLRDIFIIFLGLGAFLTILLLIALIVAAVYLVLKVNDLIRLLNREIRPVLNNFQQTTHTVRGTTSFISEQAARPIIKTAGFIAAIQAIFNALFRRRS
jgi:hypothetical protein